MKKLIDKLREERTLTSEEFAHLLSHYDDEALAYINQQAREVATAHFGQGVYIRGLIEISNYCRNNCNYCGIRKDNWRADRYRLSKEMIWDCCEHATNSDSAHSFSREAKIRNGRTMIWRRSLRKSAGDIPNVPSRCLSVKNRRKLTNAIL